MASQNKLVADYHQQTFQSYVTQAASSTKDGSVEYYKAPGGAAWGGAGAGGWATPSHKSGSTASGVDFVVALRDAYNRAKDPSKPVVTSAPANAPLVGNKGGGKSGAGVGGSGIGGKNKQPHTAARKQQQQQQKH